MRDTISPIDGRYAQNTWSLIPIFGNNALIKHRVIIEIEWLKFLSKAEIAPQITEQISDLFDDIVNSDESIGSIKKLELITKHDMKSVEIYIAGRIKEISPKLAEFVHFACTSEDICNIAYAMTVKSGMYIVKSKIESLMSKMGEFIDGYSSLSMLSRTHGQAATPTTLGKEIANFYYRLHRQLKCADNLEYLAKINGAVGNFNAHVAVYPNVDWNNISLLFLSSLGLTQNPYTTQIEPHDWLAEVFDVIARVNTILIDFCRDMWGYISIDYFRQRVIETEVGSSTMPHKINPIHFENAEGNLGVANAMFHHFCEKLPISRWQRDLSDSTVMRNIGVAFAHSIIAYDSILSELDRVTVNESKIADDLDNNWEIIAEPIQTILRKNGFIDSYEKIKFLTCVGHTITREDIHKIIDELDVSEDVKEQMRHLNPTSYTGLAKELALSVKTTCKEDM